MDKNDELSQHHAPDPARDMDSRHEQELDTVAQKPTHIGTGAPETEKAVNAHLDSQNPLAGAQGPEELKGTEFGHVHRVAAGLPAVYQSAKFTYNKLGLVRGVRTWLDVNKKNGFDCQSCAWPNPDHDRHVFEFCENGVKAVTDDATRKRIDDAFFKQHSIADLAKQSDYWLNEQGRLTKPMVKRAGATHYTPIAWEEAFSVLAKELNGLPTPDAAAFYTSGRTSNEAAFLWQLFSREFGTNNLPDCSNMCHESSGAALNETIGIGKGCVTLDDFEKTDLILIVGQNPGTNHPRMMTSLERAKKNGAKILSINPMPETGLMSVVNPNPQEYKNPLAFPYRMLLNKGVALTDLWLPVRINGDLAVFKGIMKEMLAEEEKAPGTVFDHDFIREHTVGYEEMIADLRTTDWDDIVFSSGLTRHQIRQAAEMCLGAKSVIACWAMGLTQTPNAVATIQSVMNFLLLRGDIGRPGAGPCPVRGHSNVQGDRTMGIWERMNDKFMEKLGKEFAFTPPQAHGVDTVEAIKHMHEGKIHAFIGMGGNFLSATPDTEYTARALSRCRLTAHVSTKLNRAHVVTGEVALILPCRSRTEIDRQATGKQFVTVEDSMGVISSSRGDLEPASKHAKSEVDIVCGLAEATLQRSTTPWRSFAGNYDLIRDRIERMIPGFERFNERIKANIFYLPNDARDKRKFNNGIGKAKFTTEGHTVPRNEMGPDEYVMMTIRTHDQFNTTIYGLDDRYRGIYNGRRVIFMNPDDVKARGLQQGQIVDLTSHFEGEERVAKHFLVAPFEIPRGCTATYFPETNVLVPINSTAARSNTPTSKFIRITVVPAKDVTEAIGEIRVTASEATRARFKEPAMAK